MAKGPKALKIVFSPSAQADLVSIWQWSAEHHGERTATSYAKFLLDEVERIATSPLIGVRVSGVTGVFRFLAKRRSRGYGHIVFYAVRGEALYVLALFHSAQDWQSKIEGMEEP